MGRVVSALPSGEVGDVVAGTPMSMRQPRFPIRTPPRDLPREGATAMTRCRTYRYLLQPTSGQRVQLDALLRRQCELYNAALEERIGSTLHHKGSEAAACRERGWGVGTRLVGDEGYGPTVIEITAVGDSSVLAKRLGHAGDACKPSESSWVLWCRDWSEANDDEIPVPLAVGSRVRIRNNGLIGVVLSGPDHSGFYDVDCGDDGRWRAGVSEVHDG